MTSPHPYATRAACRPGRLRRRGFSSVELVFTLPILGIIVLGLFEFSMLFYARSSVVEASRVGARAAALAGVSDQQIEAEIRKVLSPRLQQGLEVNYTPGGRAGDVVVVGVGVPMSVASPDLLWPIGYRLQNRQLYSETRMIKE